MPFNRPSLPELIARIGSDIESRLPGTDARTRRSNLAVLARIEAGVAHGLYGYLDHIARQVIIDTADSDVLERWAAVWGLSRRSAINASGVVVFSGNNGTLIPAGLVLQRADGLQFLVAVTSSITSGTAQVLVTATEPGDLGNTEPATPLALAAQVLGLSGVATVGSGGIVSGADVESDDSLRARLLTRIQQPPHGGAAHDYVQWALEVPGVTRAWVHPLWMGAGTVGVVFVRDNDPSPIPDSPEVAAVQAYIEARRPVTAEVYVIAPTPLVVPVTLSVTPDTPAIRAAVAAELVDVFRREATPGVTLRISHLREAVSLAAGEEDHVITAPAGDVVATAGQMPVLGTITWA